MSDQLGNKKVSRREFALGMATVAAGGALAAMSQASPAQAQTAEASNRSCGRCIRVFRSDSCTRCCSAAVSFAALRRNAIYQSARPLRNAYSFLAYRVNGLCDFLIQSFNQGRRVRPTTPAHGILGKTFRHAF